MSRFKGFVTICLRVVRCDVVVAKCSLDTRCVGRVGYIAIKDSLTHCLISQGWAPSVLPFYINVCLLVFAFCVCIWVIGLEFTFLSVSFFYSFTSIYVIHIFHAVVAKTSYAEV